ncbi:MAG: hypothetical protein JNK41_02075 [Saprospiraceae bacterium]|nr:hypothetical protein [Saprospiraceae bacterium]
MSNRLFLLFMLVVCAGQSPAQTLYDNCYGTSLCCDSTVLWNQFISRTEIFHFNNGTIKNKDLNIVTGTTRTYLANKSGELQFVSNGCVIIDSDGHLIPDDFGLIKKYKGGLFCSETILPNGKKIYYGAATLQSCTSIPNQINDNDFTLFTIGINRAENWDNIPGYNDVIIFSQINKENKDKTYKVYNETMLQLPESVCGGCKLVKHADGESWWLIIPLRTAGSFFSIHVSRDGLPLEHHISHSDYPFPAFMFGTNPSSGVVLQLSISNDGKKLATLDVHKGNMVLYYINRCTGSIYNPKKIYQFEGNDTISYYFPLIYSGMAFSPNSRYLYAGYWEKELQFDTDANDIEATKYQVAHEYTYKINIDTVGILVPEYAFNPIIDFYDNYLSPSGKIIISGSNRHITNNWYAVIEDPDQGGIDCNINLFGFKSNYDYVTPAPNIPNFDLGPLPPGSCNKSNTDAEIESKNVDGSIVISVKNIPLGTKRVCLKIYDMLGRLLSIECFDVIPFQDYSKEIVLDHSYLHPACYVATAEFDTGGFVSKKVLVMK